MRENTAKWLIWRTRAKPAGGSTPTPSSRGQRASSALRKVTLGGTANRPVKGTKGWRGTLPITLGGAITITTCAAVYDGSRRSSARSGKRSRAPHLRRRPGTRACLGAARWPRIRRQEWPDYRARARLFPFARRGGDDSPAHRRRALSPSAAAAAPCASMRAPPRPSTPRSCSTPPMRLVSHHRASRSMPQELRSGVWRASLWARCLPGRMPL